MAVCTINKKDEKKLVIEGVTDSKLLTPIKRKQLFGKIKDICKEYKIIKIYPEEIDQALNDPSNNLNLLEAAISSKLIDSIETDKVILDCPSHNITKYANIVKSKLNRSVEVVAEHKADVNYPIVSAASILAKVTRDEEIEILKKKYGVDFGSGYPSDPKTKEFLKNNFENKKYNTLFRKTWEPYKRLVMQKNQKNLFDF